MEKFTVTEALQEIKTTISRLEKKRAALMPYIARDHRARDPFESTGGSTKHVREERQSIADLETRVVKIRTAIQKTNIESMLTIGGTSRSVSDWLTWRREISKNQVMFLDHLLNGIRSIRTDTQRKGGRVTAIASAEVNLLPDAIPEVVVSLDEQELLKEKDRLEETLGSLDGKLSLFNATTVIEL